MESDGGRVVSESPRVNAASLHRNQPSSFHSASSHHYSSSSISIPIPSPSLLKNDGPSVIASSGSPGAGGVASGSLSRRTGSISSAASSSADSSSTVGGGGSVHPSEFAPCATATGGSRGGGGGGGYVRVLFDYDYTKKDGTHIRIARDQIYHLVDRTNDVWWRVRPTSKTVLAPEMKPGKAFYLPANYVEVSEGNPTSSSALAAPTPTGNSSNGSSRNGSVKSASSSSSSQLQPPHSQQQQQQQQILAATPPQRYENWSVKTAASPAAGTRTSSNFADSANDAPSSTTSAVMTSSTPSVKHAEGSSTNVDYSSKKSVAEKRQSFELMSSSTTSVGSTSSHAPSLSQYPVATPPQQQHLSSAMVNSSLKTGTTAPVAVPGGKENSRDHQMDDYDEVDDDTRAHIIAHHNDQRPLPQIPGSDAAGETSTSSGIPTATAAARTNQQQKTHHQQSSSYDSGIDNPCYARLDELQQQMMASSIGALGGNAMMGVIEGAASDRKLDADEDKTGSSNTLDTEDSQSITDIDVLEIGSGGGRSSFKSNSKVVNLSSFKNPVFQQQQQQQQQQSQPREGSPLSSFSSLEKKSVSQRRNKLSDSSDDVFDGFVKKSSLLNSFTTASPGSSAAPLKSKAATLAVVDPPRVPSFFESSPTDAISTTKSLERDDQMSQRMESVGADGSIVGGSNVSRQRPNSFNYMGARGGGVDMGMLKNKLRKTSSREMLAEKDDDDGGNEDRVKDDDEDDIDDDDGGHRRRTVGETRKSLEDLSAAAAAEKESWKTKSCEHLLGGKSKKSKKESRLPPGWTKQFDSVAERDVYLFKDGEKDVRWLSEVTEGGRLYYFPEDSTQSMWKLPSNPLIDPNRPESLPSEDERSRASSCSLDHDASGSVNDDSLSSSGELLLDDGRNRSNSSADNLSSANVSPHSLHASLSRPETLRKGYLNYTKYQYGQKKLNKNWNKAYVSLISNWLLFYANEKKAREGRNQPYGKPEFRIDLIDGRVEDGKDKTRRHNALLVTAFTPGPKGAEIQVLLQSDSLSLIEEWKDDLLAVCRREQESQSGALGSPASNSSLTPEPSPSSKSSQDCQDPLSESPGKTSIFDRKEKKKTKKSRAWLENWFRRRPSMESVKEKGLLKSRVVFGANIEALATREKSRVPSFVVRCTSALETRDALRVDGIYRINGNTADIQKLRFLVDEGQPYDLLDASKWDVHTLSGALKLFFRELEQPLIPWNVFEKALEILRSVGTDGTKAKSLETLLNKQMPPASRSTLVLLCKHLVKIVALKSENRMQASNLAICFGPTLIWSTPAADEAAAASGGSGGGGGGANIAINMMNQSQIVEFLLSNCEQVFVGGGSY